MLLQYFTEEAYDQLLNNINNNAKKYSESNGWIEEYFEGQDYYSSSQSVEVNRFIPFTFNSNNPKNNAQKSEEDLINTRLMYDAFKNLTPLQASNKYMWTYLCHAEPEYWKYIQNRWMVSEREHTIKTRFFVTSYRSLRDNALSRLWWYGHLTYDSDQSDHYALTKILFMNQTICKDVMDTLNRRNITRIKGVLLAIKDFAELVDDAESIIKYFRECQKYLNHYAAVTNLDFLDVEDIHDLAYNYMIKLKNQNSKKKNKVK